MKALLFLSCLLVTSSLFAQSNFQVDLVIPAKKYLYVDGAWQKGADCVEAKISVAANTASKDAVLKAYFFAADGKLLHTEGKPTSQGDGNGGTVRIPAQFEHGKKYSVFFGIPSSINTGAGKWKRAIVVFGSGTDFANKIYPKDDLAKFDFPEKTKTSSQ